MKLETLTYPELHQKLSEGATVVTGNARLSASLTDEYSMRAIEQGLLAWESPLILPWKNWVRTCWETLVFEGVIQSPALLLTTEQEQYVWEAVIEASGASVLRPEATAKKACEAWRQLIDWQVDFRSKEFDANEDTEAFRQWSSAFLQRCDEQDWLAESYLPEALINGVSEDKGQASAGVFGTELILAGFDELTPLQQSLAEAIQLAGGSISWCSLQNSTDREVSVKRIACTDSSEEIHLIARWARKHLDDNPETRIGVVAPDLSAHRAEILRQFTELLVPANLLAEGDEILPWNISLGLPLRHWPVIVTAFSVLDLFGGQFSVDQAGPLLTSPFLLGAADELASRAMLDRRIRDIGEQKPGLQKLAALAAETEEPWYSPQLASGLEKLRSMVDELPVSTGPSDWVKVFSDILEVVGWAKDRDYSRAEYQAIEAFRKLLTRFSGLQLISDRMRYARALSLLKRLAAAQSFQPRTEQTPIQVLGMYEVIGQQFDVLWVMDMHDGIWPSSPQPNPFIPLALQRRLAMPHADNSRELAVAGHITARLKSAAATVLISYPLKKGEELLRVSPLIQDIEETDIINLKLPEHKSWSQQLMDSQKLETLDDDPVPALTGLKASGGSGIFKYQSLCPFRAFAQYRLSASALAVPQPGLDAMKRGQLFHHVLELFWKDVKDQRSLLELSDEQLGKKIDSAINQAIVQLSEKIPGILTPRFSQLEAMRLKSLTLPWLELEKQRADFTVVDLEKKITKEINGIEVRLFIDRIDRLADGSRVVIDYKTGMVNPNEWFGDRPEDPQLPLYSMVSMVEADEVSAVLFGQLRADEVKFSGVVASEGLIPGLPTRSRQLKESTETWPQVLNDWQQVIKRLAEDFRQGRAAVSPKKPDTCNTSYCELSGLCRINELLQEAEND